MHAWVCVCDSSPDRVVECVCVSTDVFRALSVANWINHCLEGSNFRYYSKDWQICQHV